VSNAPATVPVLVVPEDVLSTIPDRPPTNILEAQIVLTGLGISSGSVDGVGGYQTMQALRAFQNSRGLDETGRLDPDTQEQLRIVRPLFRRLVLKPEDFQGLVPVPDTWLGKSKAPQLGFESILESVAERSHSSPALLRKLNPGVDWSTLQSGQELIVPNTLYPPARRAALARISLEHRHLRVFDADGDLLAHFPCSIGKIAERRPVGELQVASVVKNPNYTFNPAVFPESEEGRKLGLSRAGYGIHGTPLPEMVGRTESHGCFRLANWNADYLRRMAWVGMPIWVEL
jgi:lipoprotein-anchoring transpeptidase ErfK/SrfK